MCIELVFVCVFAYQQCGNWGFNFCVVVSWGISDSCCKVRFWFLSVKDDLWHFRSLLAVLCAVGWRVVCKCECVYGIIVCVFSVCPGRYVSVWVCM